MAQHHILLHLRTSKIEVAILQPDTLINAGFVANREGHWSGGVENLHLPGDEFDFAGGNSGILGARGASGDLAGYSDYVFGAHLGGDPISLLCDLGIKYHLEQAASVTQINEDESAMVSPAVDPTSHADPLPNMPAIQLAAIVGSIPISHRALVIFEKF